MTTAPLASAVTAYVGLGSNLGDRLAHLRDAVARLAAAEGITVNACSPVYESAPLGPVRDQPLFLNAVCALGTTMTPPALLQRLLAIEAGLGRVRSVPQGPRTVDLDLLLYGDAVVDEPGLCVPHPQLCKRAFVLAPLLDLAPALRHPVTAEPLAAAHARLLSQTLRPFAAATALCPPAPSAPGPG